MGIQIALENQYRIVGSIHTAVKGPDLSQVDFRQGGLPDHGVSQWMPLKEQRIGQLTGEILLPAAPLFQRPSVIKQTGVETFQGERSVSKELL